MSVFCTRADASDNLDVCDVAEVVGVVDGEPLLEAPDGPHVIPLWVKTRDFCGALPPMERPRCMTTPDGRWFGMEKPQCRLCVAASLTPDTDGAEFTSVKRYGARGDGVFDDTAALQAALSEQAGKSVVYGALALR